MNEPEAGLYVEQIRLSLTGLDAAAFRQAWEGVAAHVPALRTSVVGVGLAEPVQVVRAQVGLPWFEADWSGLPEEQRALELEAFLTEDQRRGFKLDEPCLVRVALLRLGPDRYECVWTLHHIALDGWSGGLVLAEVFGAYDRTLRGGAPAPVERRPFRDYILWLREQDASRAEGHWRRELAGFGAPTPLGVPGARPEAGGAIELYAQRELKLTAEETEDLRRCAASCRVTLGTLLQGAWALWLGKYGGVDDVVFGTVVSGRPDDMEGVQQMVGMFVNTLPSRVALPGERPVDEWLLELQAREAASRGFQASALWEVQRWSEVPAGTPLFESLFVLENYTIEGQRLEAEGLGVEILPPFDRTGYPLMLLLMPGPELLLRVTYDAGRFAGEGIELLLEQLRGLLKGLVEDPSRPLASLRALGPGERELVVETWNRTAREFPRGCLHQLFEAQAARTPEATAVACRGEELSYAELERRANRLAHELQALGVRPDTKVGICVERSFDMVVAVLAALKAGGAYVPLDASYPAERLATVVADAPVPVVIAHERTRGALAFWDGDSAPRVLCLDRDSKRIATHSSTPPDSPVGPSDLAYLLYTSGSTGRPKGVAMPHGPLVNLMHWQFGDSASAVGDRTLQFAPLSFDVSCQELFATLGSGGTLELIDEDLRRDPEALLALLEEHGVARLFVPFVALQQLAEAARTRGRYPASLREIITAGEQLQISAALVEFFEALPDCKLVNQYGPTECHVVTSLTLTGPPASWPSLPSIGRPIANARAYVLDEELEPLPVGVPGELCLGGASVSRGYVGDPELTAQRYLPDPFGTDGEARIYRTGDLARFRPDGSIEFLGRADDQVKVRGFRVEPGEIEAVLLAHELVGQAAVILREIRPGDQRLVAYLSADGATPPGVDELRAHLAGVLPDYMLPSAFVALDALPMTPSGKVDRRALLASDYAPLQLRGSHVAPRGPEELALAEIWSDVLGLHDPGVHDDFFDSGGHSLLATQLVSRVRDVMQVELPLRLLFERPTIAGLAAAVRESRGDRALVAAPLVPRPRAGDPELSFAQRRLWFLDQMGSGAAYNMPWAFELVGALDLNLLTRSLEGIVARHEALRTRFPAVDGKPVQAIVPPEDTKVEVAVIDLRGLEAAERDAEVECISAEEAERPFDLASGPMLRPTVVHLTEDRHLLYLSIHHIAFDGWSIQVLYRELYAFYRALLDGTEPDLPDLPVQYADYSQWQADWFQGGVLEQQIAYWREALRDPPELRLPTDHPRPEVPTNAGAALRLDFPLKLTRALRLLSRREGVTLATTLLAAYKAFLLRITGQDDVVVGSPIANRTRVEVEDLIGFFVNSLALRTDLSGDPSFRELLQRVKVTALAAYEYQDLPFERLVDELQPERDPRRNPIFQTVFAVLNVPFEPLRMPGLEIRAHETETRTTRFDLELHLTDAPDGLTGGFCYNRDLLDRTTVERMARQLLALLEGAVAAPDTALSRLPMLGADERRLLLEEWAGSAASYATEDCLHEQFERHVAVTPDAVALSFEHESLTYAELNARANRMAHHLRALGVGPEVLVGLCLERSPDLVVAILAILKAGGGYVPIDLANPSERIAFILRDTAVPVLVTASEHLEQLPEHSAELLLVDGNRDAIEAQSPENPAPAARPENVAYVIYTSGSTGEPKGVLVEHGTVTRLFPATQAWFGFSADDVWTLFHSCAFDFSVWEMWGALLHGGRLVVVPFWVSRSPDEFFELLVREGVTVLNQTPSAFRGLIAADAAQPDAKLALRLVIFGGEALDLSSLRPWFERHGDSRPEVVNMYGITETTVHVTYRRIRVADLEEATGSVIGRPIPDLSIYVLDEHMEPVPIGVPGELYVGGAGVARGYLNRPELTAQRFVVDPHRPAPDARLYRTGDVGRWLATRELEYVGRNDEQVKVRGFRVELGEIQAALNMHPKVHGSVVSAFEEEGTGRLVAYVVPNAAEGEEDEGEVVSQWSALYDETYSEDSGQADPTFNIVGWNNSYDGEPIPAEEMREWVDEVVARIQRGRPRRVLEIGCGTGLLLFRIAPDCEQYAGLDFSQVALEGVRRDLGSELAERVSLHCGMADDLSLVPEGPFDAVVINSVAQYFPSVTYLMGVLEGAVERVAPGGRVVLGDLRHLRLLEAFKVSIEAARAQGAASAADLRRGAQQRVAQEEELVLDPELFLALPRAIPRISHVEIQPKVGRSRNELTGYRYEVILHIEADVTPAQNVTWLDWRADRLTREALRERLAGSAGVSLGVRGIPNARTRGDCALAAAVFDEQTTGGLDELYAAAHDSYVGDELEPADLVDLAQGLRFEVATSWAAPAADGAFDALFQPVGQARPFPMPRVQPRPWTEYANSPMQTKLTRELAPELRQSLEDALPSYMVPSAFVLLESIPLTANGKVDRAALPSPDSFHNERTGAYREPKSATEVALAGIWSELLGLDHVGREDDFFDLGGHSLLATQVVSRVRQALGIDLSLRQLFDAPTLTELAQVIDAMKWMREAEGAEREVATAELETGEL